MRMPDQPHVSVNPQTLTNVIPMPTEELDFLKNALIFLDENLSDDIKSDKIVSAKMEALRQKVNHLEFLIKQSNYIFSKEAKETRALLDSIVSNESE